MGGIWTTCRISKLCAFIISEWSLSQVPLVPPYRQRRVRRLGRLPLSSCFIPFPSTMAPHPSLSFTMHKKGSRLCTCFITSVLLELRRVDYISNIIPKDGHFQLSNQYLRKGKRPHLPSFSQLHLRKIFNLVSNFYSIPEVFLICKYMFIFLQFSQGIGHTIIKLVQRVQFF